jgi:osmotically-inducible protein OsmY
LLKNEINASHLSIDVADEGTVTITGWLADIDQKKRVNKIVEEIPGVEEFKSEIILVATYE